MAELKPIHSAEDYEKSLQLLAALWGAKSGTADGDQLDIIATLIDAYENVHFPMEAPSTAATARVMAEEASSIKSDIGAKKSAYVFQIYRDLDGYFRFTLVSKAGQVVLTSDTFNSKADAIKAIESLKASFPKSEIVEDAA